ncbi:MAG: hypothetical protein GOMPHAMPRED_000801 [Gomphillus americanus]|uniref:Peptidase A1 domain-containing protein n=1 Tax=Gomphillus americanus TaxID=1940652 RepID=A0A8H3ICF0_9LECA|nr:MAG: hypothetical protein GOMPHAMPRED_000801 [Gomphillus americanus]
MHYSIVLTAALAASTFARPTKKAAGFIVKQVKNPSFVRNGTAEYHRAISKWSKKLNIGNIDDGSVTATPSDGGSGDGADEEYLCPVNINGQTFKLDFDTGSSDLWVLGPKVKTTTKHTIYQPKAGDSPVAGETWKISYGDGSGASGVVYSETVNIGSVQVTGQAVEVATSASAAFSGGTNDGLVGLAFPAINTVSTNGKPTPKNTFFQSAINQGHLSKPVMGVSLKYKAPGSYDFGFIRSNASLTYTPVDNSGGFWQFTPSGVEVGGKAISTRSSLVGIADTGTTLLLAPSDVAAAYYKGTGATLDSASGYYTFPCKTSLPDFSLVIGSAKITVPGQFINFDAISPGSSTCIGGIQPSPASIGLNIYGDVFLKAAYVVFDATNGAPKLGFAQGS